MHFFVQRNPQLYWGVEILKKARSGIRQWQDIEVRKKYKHYSLYLHIKFIFFWFDA